MAIITGTLRDFGLQSLAAYAPQVVFTPSSPAVGGPYLLSTEPVIVTPEVGGQFEANLMPTIDLRPDCWYWISIVWLDPAGNYIRKDFLDWKLRIPTSAGGAISDLLSVPSNPAQAWVGVTEPDNATPGTWWLNPTTGELKERTANMSWTTKADLTGPVGGPGPQGLPGVNAIPADAAVAGYMTTTGTSATKTAVNEKVESAVAERFGGTRWVSFGDSLTSTDANGASGNGWVDQVRHRAEGQLLLVRNAGISGNNTTQMLARLQADVIAYAPQLVTLLAGTNDLTQQVTFATYKSNMTTMIETMRAAGITVVLATIPPRSLGTVTDQRIAETTKWNSWLRQYARENGIHLLDFYSILVDPANGGYKAPLGFTDGVHFSVEGNTALADHVLTNLLPRLPIATSPAPMSNVDPNNLVGNGLMLTNVDASPTQPDGWVTGGGALTGTTETYKSGVAGFPGGRCWEIAMVNPAAFREFSYNVASGGWAVGDRLLFVARVQVVSCDDLGDNALLGLSVKANFIGAAVPTTLVGKYLQAPGMYLVFGEVVVPASTTLVQLNFLANIGTTKSATFRVGQGAIYNITRMGIS